jgi:hypothetical protein
MMWLCKFHYFVKASAVTVSAECGKTVNHGEGADTQTLANCELRTVRSV